MYRHSIQKQMHVRSDMVTYFCILGYIHCNWHNCSVTSQHFLLCRQSKIVLMYDYHMAGDIFIPISIPLLQVESTTKIWLYPTILL